MFIFNVQEIKLKEEMCEKLHAGLDKYKRKFALVRHMQSLLYEDFVKEQLLWEESKKVLEKKVSDLDGKVGEQTVHVEELAV